MKKKLILTFTIFIIVSAMANLFTQQHEENPYIYGDEIKSGKLLKMKEIYQARFPDRTFNNSLFKYRTVSLDDRTYEICDVATKNWLNQLLYKAYADEMSQIIYNNKAFHLPQEFNEFLKEEGTKIDSLNALDYAKLFVSAMQLGETQIESCEYIDRAKIDFPESSNLEIEIITNSDLMEEKLQWDFGIDWEKGELNYFQFAILKDGINNIYDKIGTGTEFKDSFFYMLYSEY